VSGIIVIVEDSERYMQELEQLISNVTTLAACKRDMVRTESEFYRRLPSWCSSRPNVFVIDVMIRYLNMGEDDFAVPNEIRQQAKEDKFYRAGIRCAKTLLASAKLCDIPIIIHSILDTPELNSDPKYPIPPGVHVCKKEANGHGVVRMIENLLGNQSRSIQTSD
jgi:hypothetical protein